LENTTPFHVDDHELEMISQAMIGAAYLLYERDKPQEAKKHLVLAVKAQRQKKEYQEALLPQLAVLYQIRQHEVEQEH